MSQNQDLSRELAQRVAAAAAANSPLCIVGSGSKAFFGRECSGQPLIVAGHRGIVDHQPKELVVRARAGTPLRELEQVLAAQGQQLAFEPPWFGDEATLGGTIACGLSGPARPYWGAARDFVLGVAMINGRGEMLRFGGDVMKNVAGYDISRLMVAAQGTLGVLLEISLKVLPIPQRELTLAQTCDEAQAIQLMNQWAGRPLPLSAACYDGLRLYLRLSGTADAVDGARRRVGGDEVDGGAAFWESIREQRHPFFDTRQPLWRLSLPPATPPLALPGKQLIDWGGAQRWLISTADPAQIQASARRTGGYASLFRGGDRDGELLPPLAPPLWQLQRQLKAAFDPQGILNPGRLYRGL